MTDARSLFRAAVDCLDRRELPEAERLFLQTLQLAPNSVSTLNNLALVQHSQGKNDSALQTALRAVAAEPRNMDALMMIAVCQKERGDFSDAAIACRQVIEVDPSNARVHCWLGEALLRCGDLLGASASFDRAIVIEPEFAEAWVMKGHVIEDMGRYDEALAAYQTALKHKPNLANARIHKAYLHLKLGNFAEGWPDYEYRWAIRSSNNPVRNFAQQQWRGDTPLDGKTILLHAEQGAGDTIMAARYVSMVAALGAEVILEVQEPLVSLLQSLDGVKAIIPRNAPIPPFDIHCPFMSLPLVFKTQIETIPAVVPYLLPSPEKAEKWRDRFKGVLPKIGIAWAGSKDFPHDFERSILLPTILPLLDVEGYAFYSLQKDLRDGDRDILHQYPNIVHLGNEIKDFEDTAAIMMHLDLVISSDTSVVHLAGALGRQFWVLLHTTSEWRWLLDRRDSPWYPSAELFRQKRPGDWSDVVNGVIARLKKR
jgi:tetratricopeptide (TPR) repeat protein